MQEQLSPLGWEWGEVPRNPLDLSFNDPHLGRLSLVGPPFLPVGSTDFLPFVSFLTFRSLFFWLEPFVNIGVLPSVFVPGLILMCIELFSVVLTLG